MPPRAEKTIDHKTPTRLEESLSPHFLREGHPYRRISYTARSFPDVQELLGRVSFFLPLGDNRLLHHCFLSVIPMSTRVTLVDILL